jgi:hypothetical protein
MWTPESELLEGAEILGITRFRQLDVAESNVIQQTIEKKFATPGTVYRLFERVKICSGIVNEQAWQWLRDYPEPSSVLAFFEKSERSDSMFEFQSIRELIDAFYEGTFYTIYITNFDCDYLLSYTVEQSIIAAGVAMDWLDARIKAEEQVSSETR